jgi:hypothetical protein
MGLEDTELLSRTMVVRSMDMAENTNSLTSVLLLEVLLSPMVNTHHMTLDTNNLTQEVLDMVAMDTSRGTRMFNTISMANLMVLNTEGDRIITRTLSTSNSSMVAAVDILALVMDTSMEVDIVLKDPDMALLNHTMVALVALVALVVPICIHHPR